MIIKQLSVFLEDKTGRLAKLTEILSENSINLIAFNIADAADYGIVRFIVDQPEKAVVLLKENHFSANTTDVVGVEIPHQPGGLNKVLQALSGNNIAIDYMYAFELGNSAAAIIRSSSNDKVVETMRQNNFSLLKISNLK